MARKVKQKNNNNTTIEGGMQAALKLAGLVPATSVTVVTDVEEKTAAPQAAAAQTAEPPQPTEWASFMGVPVPKGALGDIEEIYEKFAADMQKADDDELGRFDESTKEMEAIAASIPTELPTPVKTDSRSELLIRAAARIRFEVVKSQRKMSFRDIFKSRESRASEDARLLAQVEAEIRAQIAAR